MALLRESCVDTAWLCGASREMHVLCEWVFAGEFAKARAFLQPLANVLSAREFSAALRVIDTQQSTEKLHGAPSAHGHIRRTRNVHEARLQCFEDLVPFFRGDVGPDDDGYKYLAMPSEQLMWLLQDAVAFNSSKGVEPLDCVSIAYGARRRTPPEHSTAPRCSPVYLLCETHDATPRAAAVGNTLAQPMDWSQMRRRDDEEDKVTLSRHAAVCGDANDTVAPARGSKSKNLLSMSLSGACFVATEHRTRTPFARGGRSNCRDLAIDEVESEDTPESDGGGGAETWLEPRKTPPLRTFCDAAAQTDEQSVLLRAEATDDTFSTVKALSASQRSTCSRVCVSGGATSPERSVRGAMDTESLSLKLLKSRSTVLHASYNSGLEQLDDECDEGAVALPPSTCTSPNIKYLEEEQDEGNADDEDDDEEEEQSPDDPDEQLLEVASPFSERVAFPSVLRAVERYDQLTLDHIVRAAVVAEVREAHAMRALDVSGDGSHVAVGTNARALRVFDLDASLRQASPAANRASVSQLPQTTSFLPLLPVVMERHKHHRSAIYCVAYNDHAMEGGSLQRHSSSSNDGSAAIASGAADSSIKVLAVATSKETSIQTYSGKTRALYFSARHLLWSSCTGDLRIRCWDLEHSCASSCANLDGHVDEIQTFAFSRDGPGSAHPQVLSAALDNTIRLWDPRSGEKCERIAAHPAFALQFHPLTSRYFASGHQDGTVALWDLRMSTRSPLESLTHHYDECRAISWSPDGAWLLSSSFDGTICVMQANATHALRAMASYHQHQDKVLQAQWHPSRPAIVTSGADKFVKLWTFS